MSMRGEAPEVQKAFYNSRAWQLVRKEYLSQVGGVCERCYSRGIITPAYIVHHKEYITPTNYLDPSILLSHANLEALCLDCHNTEHHSTAKARRRFKIDETGGVEIIPDPPR